MLKIDLTFCFKVITVAVAIRLSLEVFFAKFLRLHQAHFLKELEL